MMIIRNLQDILLNSLQNFPAVAILGSRQTGKTTLAKSLAILFTESIYIDLELPSDLNKLQNPELYLKQFKKQLVIIDEIQKVPQLFSVLRALIDQDRSNGQFLILGSTIICH